MRFGLPLNMRAHARPVVSLAVLNTSTLPISRPLLVVALASTLVAPPLSAFAQQGLRPTASTAAATCPESQFTAGTTAWSPGRTIGALAPCPRTILAVAFITVTSPGSTAVYITRRATVATAGGGMWAVPGISIPSRSKVRLPTCPTLRSRMKWPLHLRRRRKHPSTLSIIALEILRAFLMRRLRSAGRPCNGPAMLGSAC